MRLLRLHPPNAHLAEDQVSRPVITGVSIKANQTIAITTIGDSDELRPVGEERKRSSASLQCQKIRLIAPSSDNIDGRGRIEDDIARTGDLIQGEAAVCADLKIVVLHVEIRANEQSAAGAKHDAHLDFHQDIAELAKADRIQTGFLGALLYRTHMIAITVELA